jgi:hypothetical protein
VAQRYVSNGVIEPELQQLLQDRDIAYVHVRDTDAGCYDFCIERTNDVNGIQASANAGENGHSRNGGDSNE